MESLALVACLGLWIASGFGGRLRTEASMDRHYALVRWFLATLFRRAIKVFHLRVEIEEPEATPEELAARLTRPVIVLSRHAGPGDSFLLVHHLLSLYRRKPRIVMKAALQLDPSLDVVINRLPHAFVKPRKSAPPPRDADRVAAGRVPCGGCGHRGDPSAGRLGLDQTGALVDLPGGRQLHAVAVAPGHPPAGGEAPLRGGRNGHAAWRICLPPRAGGAFAAIDAAPAADVIFVAHTGLDDLITVGDVWRALPMEQVIKAKWWRVPAPEVPRERAEVVAWLFDWWERIDTWIEANRPVRPGAPAPTQLPAAPSDGDSPSLLAGPVLAEPAPPEQSS